MVGRCWGCVVRAPVCKAARAWPSLKAPQPKNAITPTCRRSARCSPTLLRCVSQMHKVSSTHCERGRTKTFPAHDVYVCAPALRRQQAQCVGQVSMIGERPASVNTTHVHCKELEPTQLGAAGCDACIATHACGRAFSFLLRHVAGACLGTPPCPLPLNTPPLKTHFKFFVHDTITVWGGTEQAGMTQRACVRVRLDVSVTCVVLRNTGCRSGCVS